MQDASQGPSKQGRSNQIIFTVMILLLIVITGMQTWYIVGIKKQLNTIQDEQAAIRSAIPKEEQSAGREVKPQENPTRSELEPTAKPERQTVKQLPSIDTDLTPDNSNSSAGTPYRMPSYYAQKWEPYREIERMRRKMERAFNHPYPPDNRPDFRQHFRQDMSAPKMDVREDNNQYTVLVNIPGADAKSLSVNLDGQRLSVRGKQEYVKQDRDAYGQIIFSERRSGRFQQSITLPGPVEQQGMQTQSNHDVLTITIPKMK